jgi:cathepsin L
VATITGYVTNPTNSYDDLMNSLVNEGPIAITVDASQWGSYAGGIFDGCNQENPDLDHAVLLVGYGTENGQDYWLVRNRYHTCALLHCTCAVLSHCLPSLTQMESTSRISFSFDIDRMYMPRFIHSWGPAWGEQGYIRLAKTSDESTRCGTDTSPADGVGCEGGPSSVEVCGTCGILYDTSYPTGGALA